MRIDNTGASGGACPLCGASYYLGGSHGEGVCIKPQSFAPMPLTEFDLRRVLREELARFGLKPAKDN